MPFQNDILAGASATQGASSEFSGSPASGYTAWWRSDSGVTLSGSLVDKWTDKSASEFTVVPEDGFSTTKVTYNSSDADFNNKPSLESTNNTPHQYESEGQTVNQILTDSNDWHVFVVGYVHAANTNFSYPEMWVDKQGYGWIGPQSDTAFVTKNNSNAVTVSSSEDTLFVLEWINNSGGGGSGWKTKATSSSGTDTASSTAYTWGPGYTNEYVMFGGTGGSSMTFMGKMSELIFYASEQTGGNLTTLQSYFEDNYAVSFS